MTLFEHTSLTYLLFLLTNELTSCRHYTILRPRTSVPLDDVYFCHDVFSQGVQGDEETGEYHTISHLLAVQVSNDCLFLSGSIFEKPTGTSSETLGGLDTIRAFGKSSQFSDNFDSMLDANTRTMYCNKTADRLVGRSKYLVSSLI